MGIGDFFAKLFGSTKKQSQVLCVGLDNSGKSTIINHLKPSDSKTEDVVGFTVEKFRIKALNFTVFDMSGQEKDRNLWEQYYKEAQAIIFVIDSTDKKRFDVAKSEIELLLEHPYIKHRTVPVLFLANKIDLRDAATPLECITLLGLDKIAQGKPWHMCASNALTGEGLHEALKWLSKQLK